MQLALVFPRQCDCYGQGSGHEGIPNYHWNIKNSDDLCIFSFASCSDGQIHLDAHESVLPLLQQARDGASGPLTMKGRLVSLFHAFASNLPRATNGGVVCDTIS